MVSLTCKEAEAAYQAALRLCRELRYPDPGA